MKDITKHLINAGLAGMLVFLGAFSTGNYDTQTIILAFVASSVVAVTQLKQYFDNLCKPRKQKKPIILGSIL